MQDNGVVTIGLIGSDLRFKNSSSSDDFECRWRSSFTYCKNSQMGFFT